MISGSILPHVPRSFEISPPLRAIFRHNAHEKPLDIIAFYDADIALNHFSLVTLLLLSEHPHDLIVAVAVNISP